VRHERGCKDRSVIYLRAPPERVGRPICLLTKTIMDGPDNTRRYPPTSLTSIDVAFLT
jgi:hypothetical protein